MSSRHLAGFFFFFKSCHALFWIVLIRTKLSCSIFSLHYFASYIHNDYSSSGYLINFIMQTLFLAFFLTNSRL
jgi:hypothetical protein